MNSKDQFNSYLNQIINSDLESAFILEILNSFESLQLKKNDSFVSKNQICKYFCFIKSGILQHSIDVNGEEKTTYLALKNTCTSALKSFLHQQPSRKNIKALSNCELLVITVDNFNRLIQENTVFFQFYHKLIENQIFLIDDYRIDLLTLSPEERYQKLLMNDPELLQSIPLHYLASFLGISKRHMSRIRKNIK